MAWKPYQDQENRAYSSILTSLFPEQTRTLPRILVWSVIFLLDLIIVVSGGVYLGLLPSGSFLLLLAVLFGLFWVQGWLWGKICQLLKKRRETRNAAL